jgi:integrase
MPSLAADVESERSSSLSMPCGSNTSSLGRKHPEIHAQPGRRILPLRHSFASQLVMAGTPLRQVQEWLGHSSIVMTMRYSHLAPGGGREFLSALDAGNHYGNLTATEGVVVRIDS